MNRKLCLFFASALILSNSCSEKDPVDYVNPYMGNVSHLLVPTYPTVQLPNAMLRVYPEREDYTTQVLKGLPLEVISHRGKSVFNLSVSQGDREPAPYFRYRYDSEKVTPYSYQVVLRDEDIAVSFAPSRHSAIYRFDFTREGVPMLIINTGNGNASSDGPRITAMQNIDGLTVHLSAELSETPVSVEICGKGRGEYAVLRFEPSVRTLYFKYGVSFIDCDQAGDNVRREIPGFDLKAVACAGREEWNAVLSKLSVRSRNENDKTVFYTSLYRVYERMVDFSEYGRYYSAYDGKVHESDRAFYTDDWVWDTYRAAHPLRTLIDVEKESDMIQSYLDMAEQMEDHWLPTFPEVTGDSRRMNCNHSVAVIADAWAKGVRGFNLAQAYEYARDGIIQKTLLPWCGGRKGELTDFYWKNGYLPALGVGERETSPEVHEREKRQPVAVTLGTAYDEWCLWQIASELGLEEAEVFEKGSFNYRNIFNEETGFFHPKDSNGDFLSPFDYELSGGQGARDTYNENTGWIYRWDVQHNIADLVQMMGGAEKFTAELDRMFETKLSLSKYAFYSRMPDHTGNVGQFSMANEPALHIPYLYCYAGKPWRTQKQIRTLVGEWFRNDLMGVPGDEDGGGMSAFVVFSMMGFYPVTPGLPVYVIGSPWFEKMEMQLSGGRRFTVRCRNWSEDHIYIQSAKLNGKPLDRPWISHSEITDGGELVFEMGADPNREWAAASVPPSFRMQ
ncbi:MAG: GH92 family glycosyl hydrolase [Candidatus Cryptobacteroides sp.]